MRWWLIFTIGCRFHFDVVGGDGDSSVVDNDTGLPRADGNVAFVTSTRSTIMALGGGLAGADAKCQTLASAAGLTGTYAAWLSTSTESAISRLAGARGWVRRDGAPFADTTSDIAAGRIFYPLNVDELGIPHKSSIDLSYTATLETGVASASTCADLTGFGLPITIGDNNAGSVAWTNASTDTCDVLYSMYCFGTSRNIPLTIIPPPSHRFVFVSTASWNPGGGLASADSLCQLEATSAGLPGTYVALLATSTASASSRLDFSGAPWIRVDGIPIVFGTDVQTVSAPPSVMADGSYVTGKVYAGADYVHSVASLNCNDFTSNATGQSSTVGVMESTFNWFEKQLATVPCNTTGRVYCFQL